MMTAAVEVLLQPITSPEIDFPLRKSSTTESQLRVRPTHRIRTLTATRNNSLKKPNRTESPWPSRESERTNWNSSRHRLVVCPDRSPRSFSVWASSTETKNWRSRKWRTIRRSTSNNSCLAAITRNRSTWARRTRRINTRPIRRRLRASGAVTPITLSRKIADKSSCTVTHNSIEMDSLILINKYNKAYIKFEY